MARPLTKTTVGGGLYTRPIAVEAEIDRVVSLSRSELQARLLIADRNAPGHLRSECLVHLVRQGRRSDDQPLISAVLPVLLRRCEANLLVKVPDGGTPDAESLRQEILEDLTDLFVMDGMGDFPDELDFYECRFNRAFRALRIDAVRRDARRRKRSIAVVDMPPSDATSEPDAYEDACAQLSEIFAVLTAPESEVFRKELIDAIEALPDEERNAVILYVRGYKVESRDPEEETVATRCNCTGRTIRNRLARSAAKLSHFKEDL